MIATSTVVMLILMSSTVYQADHIWWSDTKVFMAVYMGATMAVIMLAFMLKMYDDKKVNLAIFGGSAIVFALFLWLARGQETVGDAAWMRAMIPHHSIAILTSERAQIRDPRVRRLADDIILAQKREIAEMEALVHDLDASGFDGPTLAPGATPVQGGTEEATGPGAPALTVGLLTGEVLMLTDVRVVSDAWIVVHPQAADGSADVSRVLGRAFAQHERPHPAHARRRNAGRDARRGAPRRHGRHRDVRVRGSRVLGPAAPERRAARRPDLRRPVGLIRGSGGRRRT